MLTDQWVKWEPLQNLSPRYHFQSCIDRSEGPVILLANTKNKIEVKFDSRVFSYKKTHRQLKKNTLKHLEQINGDSFIKEWSLFKVTNSTFVRSLSDESYGFYSITEFHHFVFITTEAVVEVVCGLEPSINLIVLQS